MPWTTPRSDPRFHRNAGTLDAERGESIQVGRFRCFQFGQSTWTHRQSAKTIRDEHYNFAAVVQLQLTGQGMNVHGATNLQLQSRKTGSNSVFIYQIPVGSQAVI